MGCATSIRMEPLHRCGERWSKHVSAGEPPTPRWSKRTWSKYRFGPHLKEGASIFSRNVVAPEPEAKSKEAGEELPFSLSQGEEGTDDSSCKTVCPEDNATWFDENSLLDSSSFQSSTRTFDTDFIEDHISNELPNVYLPHCISHVGSRSKVILDLTPYVEMALKAEAFGEAATAVYHAIFSVSWGETHSWEEVLAKKLSTFAKDNEELSTILQQHGWDTEKQVFENWSDLNLEVLLQDLLDKDECASDSDSSYDNL